ncbi:MAG: CDP-glycerol glycerophosphotransferase family protein [Clostridiales bacterium]|nr:CDP-glycerol glycerophosphotransferase family protein [Clostridiales bacterium]
MYLYIDPGTGSMLFSIIIGVFGVVVFLARTLIIKLKFIASGGKKSAETDKNTLPIVIFSDHKRYWNVFKPVCDEMEKRKKTIYYWTASPDDPALDEKYEFVKTEFIGEGNKAISRMNMLRATMVFSTTPSLDVFQWKRSKFVKYYVHIVHMATDLSIYKMFGLDFYDAVITGGEYQMKQVRDIEAVRGIPQKEVLPLGIPYMDTMLQRFKDSSDSPKNDKPVVLLAPTWGGSSLLNRFGSEFIDRLIDTGYEIVIRPHPQSFTADKALMDSLQEKYKDGEKVSWNRDTDNFDILKKADILISDFSGVVFDFSLIYDKPVIYVDTEFNPDQYDCSWLDETPWVFRTLPSIGRELKAENASQIKAVIDECLSGGDSEALAKGRDKARAEAWANIGKSAPLIADYLCNKYDELLKQAKKEASEGAKKSTRSFKPAIKASAAK